MFQRSRGRERVRRRIPRGWDRSGLIYGVVKAECLLANIKCEKLTSTKKSARGWPGSAGYRFVPNAAPNTTPALPPIPAPIASPVPASPVASPISTPIAAPKPDPREIPIAIASSCLRVEALQHRLGSFDSVIVASKPLSPFNCDRKSFRTLQDQVIVNLQVGRVSPLLSCVAS